jgi:predicted aspartyl protease
MTKGKKVGRFSVEIEVANNDDLVSAKRGHLDPDQVRRTTIRGVVDCGATRLVLPGRVAKQLGLEVKRKVRVKYANGQRALRPEVAGVHLTLQGRDDVFSAVVEPKRDSAFIGALVLEDLDFLIDCTKMCLYPRDPHHIVNEIE